MIIVKLTGGLGNQMFQYAAGRALALKHKTPLKLDLSWYNTPFEEGITPREYELGIFNIEENIANSDEIRELTSSKLSMPLKTLYYIIKKPYPKSEQHIMEKGYCFNKELIGLGDNVYLEGYWQSEKYFEHVKDIIKSDFIFKIPLNNTVMELKNKISSEESVSLHVRRGDFVKDKVVNQIHGICSPEYYSNCITYIKERINNPIFYIFSDDITWVKENLAIENEKIYIDENISKLGHEQMFLMSNCKHNITANSSFSWWGAWLNNNQNKMVLCPDEWIKSEKHRNNDIVSDSWIKM